MLFGRKYHHLARLLVVEDEPLLAFDTEHLLSEDGYTIVATVDRVADALAVIEGGAAIDLVLADVNLADGNGTSVAIAARERGIPVVFITGSCPADAETLAVGCLGKPYSQRTLLAAIGAVEAVLSGTTPRRIPDGFRLFVSA